MYVPMLRVILHARRWRGPFYPILSALIMTVFLFYEECPVVSEIDSVDLSTIAFLTLNRKREPRIFVRRLKSGCCKKKKIIDN